MYLCLWAMVSESFIYLRSFNLYTSGDFMVFGICENGEGKLVFLFLQGLEVCTGCLGYMFLESCPVKNESLFPHPLHPLLPASLAGTWPGSGRQQVVRGEGLRPLEPIHPPATFPQAAVPIACAGSVTSDAMDRLGSRCPLPGSTRPSIFICFLVSVPQYNAVNPLASKPPAWGLREEGAFVLYTPGILSWGQAGSGWMVKSLGAPPSVLEIVV